MECLNLKLEGLIDHDQHKKSDNESDDMISLSCIILTPNRTDKKANSALSLTTKRVVRLLVVLSIGEKHRA